MTLERGLIRQTIESKRRLDALPQPEMSQDLISPFRALPGLRGFWTLGSFDAIGDATQWPGAAFSLTYNGNPTYNYDGLSPYLDLDGVGDYLSRPTEAAFDITGTETYVAAAVRGLTFGGWFWFNNAAGATENCLSKWGAAGQRSYRIIREVAGTSRVLISVDGTAIAAESGQVMGASAWTFIVGRFDPSVELAIFTNNIKDANVAAIPASIFNSNADFRIGINGTGTELMTGRASLCFLCAAYLSDALISSLFQQTRGAFGV